MNKCNNGAVNWQGYLCHRVDNWSVKYY